LTTPEDVEVIDMPVDGFVQGTGGSLYAVKPLAEGDSFEEAIRFILPPCGRRPLP